ncbi:2-hydroxyacyl-CoA dehydratase [Halomonas daqingensis]|uniref:2-hydroxyacyl-CoA dehydratase n=1 Tax=Billgrantia desiderata TaxID=52021 RepID=A0AAW4YWA1_9GAMM|nr:2-hydroxyacyl-CoA dehydratase [Halomonas desiderata]MCE8043748.1 2-hydroxyacyl-CoA dehydratase [Halomonas desiderata]MCE8048322.1 2-hydroxyacyl-CoA dehydratase [Halomonas desiderata]MCE8052135.1 2-hydroxyacyl-CoA dehydratase [Halomonas desiderata]
MAFRQVKDLLVWIRDFHARLGEQYAQLAEVQQSERMRMALTFLADRERLMANAMQAYLEDAEEGLLTTWLIDSQEFGHPSVLERIPRCMGCRDTQDILANVMTAHQTLKDMYRLRAELAAIPQESELFERLAEQQDAEARLQTRDFARLDMY